MRASPACQVTLRHFGVWHSAVVLLATAGALLVGSWLLAREEISVVERVILAATGALSLGALAASLWRIPVQRLRWDGQAWHLDSVSGELTMKIDLGFWMLLHFRPEPTGTACWLPVQRRGLEAQWHGLRCAVYSPRPPVRP
jgi:hypothetical protein